MTATLLPDVELIAGSYLRAQPAIAALVGDRVGGKTPRTTDEPWVRVTQTDLQRNRFSPTLHLVTVFLQLDCYGSNDPAEAHEEASLLARTVMSELHGMTGIRDDAIVSSVRIEGCHRAPDPDLVPARERFIVDAAITCHP